MFCCFKLNDLNRTKIVQCSTPIIRDNWSRNMHPFSNIQSSICNFKRLCGGLFFQNDMLSHFAFNRYNICSRRSLNWIARLRGFVYHIKLGCPDRSNTMLKPHINNRQWKYKKKGYIYISFSLLFQRFVVCYVFCCVCGCRFEWVLWWIP